MLGDKANFSKLLLHPGLRVVMVGVFIVTVLAVTLPRITQAALDTPQILSYQGRLTDAQKITVPDGSRAMAFSIWDSSAGGACLYAANGACPAPGTTPITVADGIFNVLIGDTGAGMNAFPDTLFDTTAERWLEVSIDGETLTPRRRIVSSATALQAGNASLLDSFDTSQIGGTVAFVPVTDSSGNLVLSANLTVDTDTLFVDAGANRVGIGTVTPGSILDIQQNQSGSTQVRVTNADNAGTSDFMNLNGTDSQAVMRSYGSTNTYFGGQFQNWAEFFGDGPALVGVAVSSHLATAPIAFFTGAGVLERMRIDPSGNVGIGTTTPGGPLHIERNQDASMRIFATNSSSGSNAAVAFDAVADGGQILMEHLSSTYTGGLGSVFQDRGLLFTDFASSGLSLWSRTGNINFHVDAEPNPTLAMTIANPSGFVGIGESAPSARLHVNTGAAGNIGMIVRGAASQTASLTEWRDSTNAILTKIDSAGNVVTGMDFLTSAGASGSSSTEFNTISELNTFHRHSVTLVPTDGLPVLAFMDNTGILKTKKCTSANCSTTMGTVNIDTGLSGSDNISGMLASDGFPIYVYKNTSNNLKVAHCTDINCSSVNTTIIVATGDNTQSAIAALSGGSVGVVYHETGADDIYYLRCSNPTAATPCSTSTTPVNLTAAYVFAVSNPDIEMTSDNLPLVFWGNQSGIVVAAKCSDNDCSGAVTESLLGTFGSPYDAVRHSTGQVALTTIEGTSVVRYVKCTNASCSTSTSATIDSTSAACTKDSDLVIRSGDLPAISVASCGASGGSGDEYVNLTMCGNATCSAGNSTQVVASGTISYLSGSVGTSMSLNATGDLIMSLPDSVDTQFRVARILLSSIVYTGTDVGSSAARLANGYFSGELKVGSLTIDGAAPNGFLSIAGNLTPGADDTYDLGTPALRWRDLYLGPTTLHISSTAAETTTARDWKLSVQETDGASEGNFRLLEGATEIMNVTPAGFVGIGTVTPLTQLHVSSATQTEIRAVNTSAASDTNAYINAIITGSDSTASVQSIGNAAGQIIEMTQWGSAKVGALAGINLAGMGMLTTYTANTSLVVGTRSAAPLAFITGAVPAERMRITPTGFVGIGTITPAGLLDVERNQSAATISRLANTTSATTSQVFERLVTSDHSLFMGATSAAYTPLFLWDRASGGYLQSDGLGGLSFAARNAAGVMTFSTGGDTERMRIDATGNVGIGTPSPGAALQIVKNDNNNDLVYMQNTNVAGYSDIAVMDNGGTTRMAMGYGNSGVAGVYALKGYIATLNGADLIFGTSTTSTTVERMHIDTAGYVGVGMTTPNARLAIDNVTSATGSGTLSSSGTTVTGSGTLFTTELHIGDFITAALQTRMITAIASPISLTVDKAFSPVLAGASFTYTQVGLRVSTTTDAVLDLQADTDDAGGENDNPYILLRQDIGGNNTHSIIGLEGDVADVAPNGETFIGSGTNNGLLIGNFGIDAIHFGTNATTRMTINGDGNTSFLASDDGPMGVSITNADGGTSALTYLILANDVGGDESGLYRNSSTNSADFGGPNSLNVATDGAYPVTLATSNLTRLFVAGGGNVGVGTGTTEPIEKFHLDGNIRLGHAQDPGDQASLNGGIDDTQTTITVNSTTGYLTSGTLVIESEAMTYTGITGTTFTGLTRGALGTTAASHGDTEGVFALLETVITTPDFAPHLVVDSYGRTGFGTATPLTARVVIQQNTNYNGGLEIDQIDAANTRSFRIDTTETTGTQSVIELESDVTTTNSLKFKVNASGATFVSFPGTQTTNGVCHTSAGTTTTNDQIVDCSGTPSDLAEWYETTGVEAAGDIVAMGAPFTYSEDLYDPFTGQATGSATSYTAATATKSSGAYQAVFGVVSTSPHQVIGESVKNAATNPKPIALAGRVQVNVNVSNGAISVGDAITSSATAGVGMKATKPGFIIGRALSAWAGPGAGTVMVFVHTEYFVGATLTSNGTITTVEGDLALGSTSADTVTMNAGTLSLRSSTDGNTFNTKLARLAAGTCGSGQNEGWVFQTDSGTQVGHACIEQAGTDQLNFFANSFNPTSTDVAENYNAKAGEVIEKGDVVALDPVSGELYTVTKATKDNADMTLGIISTNPGITLTGVSEDGKRQDTKRPVAVALAGRVPTKANTENGPVMSGDLLTPSSTPGTAMKYVGTGPIIGKALQSLPSGTGKIEVFVRIQWAMAQNAASQATPAQSQQLAIYGDLDFAGYSITNIKAIRGQNWSIDEAGALVVKSVTADEYVVHATDEKATIGEGKIAGGLTAVLITNQAMKANSKVFLSFSQSPGSFATVSEKHDGSFMVGLDLPAKQDAAFDYWIVNVLDDRTPAAAVVPPPVPPPDPTPAPVPDQVPVPTPDSVPAPAPEPAPVPDPIPAPVPDPTPDPTPVP